MTSNIASYQGRNYLTLLKSTNTNLYFALGESPNPGSLRETFLLSQLSVIHKVNYPKRGDFLVDEQFIFEVGGKAIAEEKTDHKMGPTPEIWHPF